MIFKFSNPELLSPTGQIYDLSGALVANCAPGPNPDDCLEWDGKSSDHVIVPGGIYLYQVTLNGKSWTGTVVGAR